MTQHLYGQAGYSGTLIKLIIIKLINMRKAILLTLAASVILTMTGCLKDKKFEKQEYGIQITEVKGVAFPQVLGSPLIIGVNSQATPIVVDGPYITLEQNAAPTSDVKVTLVINNSLVTALGFTILPVTAFSVNTLVVTIPAGSTLSDVLKITLANSSLLDPLQTYGVGLTISAADQGYKVASNLKDIVIAFNIKNQYDGKYTMKGQFYHPTNDPAFSHHVFSVELRTSGPNSVRLFWPLVDDYNTPLTVNGAPACCFAAQELSLSINPTTNAVTCLNTAVGATVVYAPIPTYGTNTYNNRWVPATKTFYTAFGYSLGAGGTVALGTSRAWIDTLVYTGPR